MKQTLGLQFSVLGGILIKLQMRMSQYRPIYKIGVLQLALNISVLWGTRDTLCDVEM